ncbi:MAG: S8 family peptidase [Bacteroidales bacterium]
MIIPCHKYLTFYIACCILFFNVCHSLQGFSQIQPSHESVLPEPATVVVIAKVKPYHQHQWELWLKSSESESKGMNFLANAKVHKLFPHHKPLSDALKYENPNLVDLSLIYSVTPVPAMPPDELIFRLNRTNLFEYVQWVKPVDLLFIPNDEKIGSQYYLDRIKAFQAWDICQGDTNTIIGIVDSGSDLDHPDLKNNLAYNYNDPIDGIDNDNDGFIDNFRGWDMGDMDNEPQVIPGGSNPAHGVHMCGIAAASTDNAIGVAGVGFNCRFLPVKMNDVNDNYIAGYEGIVYAADHGSKVINCSWGSQHTAGKFGQDIINYATFNRDALVVAASGNSNNEIPFYPASYENVLSVGATGPADERMVVSSTYATSYGHYLDVCAPGAGIFNTWDYPYFYHTMSGTSMASAVASGAAALLRSHYPGYSALQIAEKLRATADKIDTLSANLPFFEKLGTGRINLLKALTDTVTPGIRILEPVFSDGNDSVFRVGDTLSLTGVFYNYLADAENVTIKISTANSFTAVLDSTFYVSDIPSSGAVWNQNNPFRFVLLPGLSSDAYLFIKISYEGTGFQSFEYLRIDLNEDYINIQNHNLRTSLTSKGKIGFNDNWKQQGTGFSYNNDITRMFSGGLMIGTSYYQVSDVLYNQSFSGWDQDFVTLEKIHPLIPSLMADREYLTRYNDAGAGSNALGIDVTQRTFLWDTPEDGRYLIHEFKLKNAGFNTLSNLYAGLFIDWDINEQAPDYDRVSWDNDDKLGITYSLTGGPVTGISLITSGPARHYAFDNDGSNGSIKLDDGFTAQEKYTALKTFRPQAGMNALGNNVSDLLASGPHLVLAGDSLVIAFAMMAADHVPGLKEAAQKAKQRYFHTEGIEDVTNSKYSLIRIYPHPVHSVAEIRFYAEMPGICEWITFDITGKIVRKGNFWAYQKGWNSFDYNADALQPGVYILQITLLKETFRIKFVKD